MGYYLTKNTLSPDYVSFIKHNLLKWYETNGRDLPWRIRGSCHNSPYHVWVSEIMLQQTTVTTVIPYFQKFIAKWPSLNKFSQATLNDVLHMWQGLGYYSRARHLYQGAQFVAKQFKNDFPQDYNTLLTIPGIGPYTAAAIASIAFYQPIIPVDGNIVRVFSRLMGLNDSVATLKKTLTSTLIPFFDNSISGDFTQALMDLGAMICVPRNPQCRICPLQSICFAKQTDQVAYLPTPAVHLPLPLRQGQAWLIVNAHHQIILTQRPVKGLLAGLWEPPTFGWDNIHIKPPYNHNFSNLILIGQVRHTFTHFKLTLDVNLAEPPQKLPTGWQWVSFKNLSDFALSALAKKIINFYRDH